MRSLILTVIWLATLVAGMPVHGQAPIRKLERVQLFGKEYVRLDDWVEANGYQMKWLRKDELVQVKTKYSTLKFEIDSRRAEINGIAVWLSVTIAKRYGFVFISPLDLQTAVSPVLYPPRNADDNKVTTICLDPGHGGKDPGNQAGRSQEKKYVLALAEEVKKLLLKSGFNVMMTRSSDNFVELPDRPMIANRRGVDLFVSLHFNSAEGGGAHGIETYCLTPALASSTNARGEGATTGSYLGNRYNEKNMALAYQVQKSLVKSLYAEDRGVRRARFAVLKTVDAPGILIEGGFMSDSEELRKITDPAHRRKMAKAIVDGIVAYKKLVER